MTKLKLKNWSHVGVALTSEELKLVYGGEGSGSTQSCGTCRCFLTFYYGPDDRPVLGDVGDRPSCYEACKQLCKEKMCKEFHITCY